MIHENLKRIRKSQGLSQSNLAAQLNVVRQTVAKWENGSSVPDAEQLIIIADLLNVEVGDLLGVSVSDDADPYQLAQELARINEQLAVNNNRSRHIWKVVKICFCAFIAVNFFLLLINHVSM